MLGEEEEPAPGEPPAPDDKGDAGGEKKPAPAVPGGRESEGMTYQDSSSDANASMQYPTRMTPGQAAIMVPAHERGHIAHAQAKAMASGREIVQAYTVVHYRMDPNTGEFVAAGGQAVITTRAKRQVQMPFRSWTA